MLHDGYVYTRNFGHRNVYARSRQDEKVAAMLKLVKSMPRGYHPEHGYDGPLPMQIKLPTIVMKFLSTYCAIAKTKSNLGISLSSDRAYPLQCLMRLDKAVYDNDCPRGFWIILEASL